MANGTLIVSPWAAYNKTVAQEFAASHQPKKIGWIIYPDFYPFSSDCFSHLEKETSCLIIENLPNTGDLPFWINRIVNGVFVLKSESHFFINPQIIITSTSICPDSIKYWQRWLKVINNTPLSITEKSNPVIWIYQ